MRPKMSQLMMLNWVSIFTGSSFLQLCHAHGQTQDTGTPQSQEVSPDCSVGKASMLQSEISRDHFTSSAPKVMPPIYFHGKRLRWSRGSVLAFDTQVHGFKPGRSSRIFQGEKILSTLSFGREVKPFVPCRRFTSCYVEVGHFQAKFIGHFSPK